MQPFTYFQPTEIVFGAGRLYELGALAARFGARCLLVTVPSFPAMEPLFARAKASLAAAGVETAHFDGVIPNPTTDVVAAGTRLARSFGAQVVVGLGGGSSMDTAKAIAVEATHEGTCWDYLYFKTPPSTRTLPVIAVTTTSGTGSQTTPCAVVTNEAAHDKSALWHPNLFARIALVDPELILSLPPSMTAQTGFDAFAHCFEAFLSNGTNPYVRILALEGIRIIAARLADAVRNGADLETRSAMAWADTLGGLAIASGGVTLPHGLGMQVGGHCPHVSHGQALAAIYPEFTRFTWASAVDRFAEVGRILDPALRALPDEAAAEAACGAIDGLLKRIGLWVGFSDLNVPHDALARIAADGQKLPDYKNNPRIATIEEMGALLERCWKRAG